MEYDLNTQKTFTIHNQYVKDLSFENPKIPGTFKIESEPTFNISVNILNKNVDQDLFEVALKLEVNSTYNNETLFHVSLDYAGLFTIITDPEELDKLLLIQAPVILFPFARRIISDAVRDGGYPPLSLDPIDFYSLYSQKNSENLSSNISNVKH